jgi:hypothetical protein
VSLLELMPAVPRDGYRIRAQVRHETVGDALAGAGVYFGHRAFPGEEGQSHVLIEVAFNDVEPLAIARELALPPNFKLPTDNEVRLCPHVYSVGASGVSRDALGAGLTLARFAPAGLFRHPWRTVVVEVRPSGVRGSWEGAALSREWQAADVRRSLAQMQAPGAKSRAVLAPGAQEFYPKGGLGLYIRHSSASFKQVRVEPLD